MHKIQQNLFEISLIFENEIYSDVFQAKNNKSLKETLLSPRYEKFKIHTEKNYPSLLSMMLGDFLYQLKNDNDMFYKEFLNKYGDLEYSKFMLADSSQYNLKGVYFYSVNDELKYIGRCRDSMQKRVNSGYGNISPKNCFIDGQATNCKVNALVTKNREGLKLKIYPMDDEVEIAELESQLIDELMPEWNGRKGKK
jgi:hypothetical protein